MEGGAIHSGGLGLYSGKVNQLVILSNLIKEQETDLLSTRKQISRLPTEQVEVDVEGVNKLVLSLLPKKSFFSNHLVASK